MGPEGGGGTVGGPFADEWEGGSSWGPPDDKGEWGGGGHLGGLEEGRGGGDGGLLHLEPGFKSPGFDSNNPSGRFTFFSFSNFCIQCFYVVQNVENIWGQLCSFTGYIVIYLEDFLCRLYGTLGQHGDVLPSYDEHG